MTVTFTEAERKALDYERYHPPHPLVQRKMEVVWLKSQGKGAQEISQLANVGVSTAYRYLAEYRAGGLERIKQVNLYRPQSELVGQQRTIEADFRAHPPATMKEAAHRIEQLTGIKRGPTQVRQFLQALGLKRRKVGMIPAKADPAGQAHFKAETLEPLLAEAKAGKKKSISSMPPILS